MDYYPALGPLKCPVCDEQYSCPAVMFKTYCSNHDDVGQFECKCGHNLKICLKTAYKDNIYMFAKEKFYKLLNMYKINPNININFSQNKDIVGNVNLSLQEGKYKFMFSDYYGGKYKLKKAKKDRCCVCFDDCKEKTVCNHSVCSQCYKQLDKCPMCRKELSLPLIAEGSMNDEEIWACK